jgi:hypothetical protein
MSLEQERIEELKTSQVSPRSSSWHGDDDEEDEEKRIPRGGRVV